MQRGAGRKVARRQAHPGEPAITRNRMASSRRDCATAPNRSAATSRARLPRRRLRSGVDDQPAQRRGQRLRVAGRHQQTGLLVLDRLGDAGMPRRDDRHAFRHRLQDDIRQPLRIAVRCREARHADRQRPAHPPPQFRVRQPAGEFDISERRRDAFQRLAHRPSPARTRGGRMAGSSSRMASSSTAAPFLLDKPPGEQNRPPLPFALRSRSSGSSSTP